MVEVVSSGCFQSCILETSVNEKATSVVDGGKEGKGPISIRDGSAALAITHGDLP